MRCCGDPRIFSMDLYMVGSRVVNHKIWFFVKPAHDCQKNKNTQQAGKRLSFSSQHDIFQTDPHEYKSTCH